MYLHLGQDMVVTKDSIIGVFDMDNCTSSKITREYLSKAEKNGQVTDISGQLPKVFAVCARRGKAGQRVYLSQISSATLLKRWESGSIY